MTDFWTMTTIAVVSALFYRYFRGKPILEGSMIILGIAIYCLLPFVIYYNNLYENGPGENIWSEEFERLIKNQVVAATLIFTYILSFKLGQALPGPALDDSLNQPIPIVLIKKITLMLAILGTLLAIRAKELIGAGYSVDYSAELMGPVGTVNILITLILLNILQYHRDGLLNIKIILSAMLTANSAVLLSMGGRMYVLIALVCLLLNFINNESHSFVARAKFVAYMIFSILPLVYIAAWRVEKEINTSSLLTYAIAEPVLTSISLASYFHCSDLPLVEIPYNFMGSIINLVPSVLLPGKVKLIPQLDCVFAPFGATHLGAALFANFGIIGGMFFMLVFGWLLKSFRRRHGNGWWLHYYFCGLLPFMFFRDGFAIFNKAFLTGVIFAFILLRVRSKTSLL